VRLEAAGAPATWSRAHSAWRGCGALNPALSAGWSWWALSRATRAAIFVFAAYVGDAMMVLEPTAETTAGTRSTCV
jgi:hypothetical protein